MNISSPTPLWLDCDPGHDDAFAILLAAHHPRLNLLGVSTVHGNASLAHTTANAGSILTALGVEEKLYYAGSPKPFCREAVHAPDIHGTTGLDGTDLLPQARFPPVSDDNAIPAMAKALMDQDVGKAWLVATGALTNVALLFATFPEVVEHIAGLSIMGGAIGDGFSDAPMGHCDPEAAQSVFSNPILTAKTTLIPLDVTHKVLATKAVQEKLLYGISESGEKGASTLRRMFYDLLLFFAHTYADVFGIPEGPPLHDPIAVAVVLSDIGAEKISFDDGDGERFSVDVVTDGKHSDQDIERGQVGRTCIRKAEWAGVRIPRGLDVGRFWDVVEECLERAECWLQKREG